MEGNPKTLWEKGGASCTLTEQQLAASDVLFNWLREQFARNGATWKYVYAHRQSSGDRRADPGSEIWSKVALKWIKELGASDGGRKFFYGSGRRIPREWNPEYAENTY